MTGRDIWIYGDLRSDRLWRDSLMVMAKAGSLARKAGAARVMVLLGGEPDSGTPSRETGRSACPSLAEAAEQALDHGADRALCITHPLLDTPRADVHARALSAETLTRRPWLVLFSVNDFGRETAAFCTQACRAGMIADAVDLELHEGRIVGRCPAWGGTILADITLAPEWDTAFVTVQPHGVELENGRTPDARIETHAAAEVEAPPGLTLKRRALQSPESRRLEEADIVVAGGAGLGDIQGFGLVRELAAALSGEVGATRPPVLHRWVGEDRLIGQTGKTVRPKLLISVGTSGAVQYTAGISEAQTIVAINRDPHAPIFQWADLGIAGDAATLLPMLVQRAKQGAMRRLTDAASVPAENGGAQPGGFGALVEGLRKARGWSREQLAQATGQTPEFVEQVEDEQLSPPVSFILRMAQAMQVDPGTFLRKEEQETLRDMRAQAYYRRTQEYSYATLTPEAQNNHLRAFMVTIEPHQAHKPVAYKHEGEEFIFVMEGVLEFTLGTRVSTLKAGEFVHFNSDVPHKLKSLSSRPTRCLVVVYTM